MNSAVPRGYRHDPYTPDLFILRCPGCDDTERRRHRSGKGDRQCVQCDRLMAVTPVSEKPGEATGEDGQRVLTDGGQLQEPSEEDIDGDRVDPENLPEYYTPAFVQISGQGLVYVADYTILDSGWVRVTEWRDETAKLPPKRVSAIRDVQTEYYGERELGGRPKRVADEDRREQAKADDVDAVGPEVGL